MHKKITQVYKKLLHHPRQFLAFLVLKKWDVKHEQ